MGTLPRWRGTRRLTMGNPPHMTCDSFCIPISQHHQKFQVLKIEVLNLMRLFLGVGFPLHKTLHTAYIGEYLVLGT